MTLLTVDAIGAQNDRCHTQRHPYSLVGQSWKLGLYVYILKAGVLVRIFFQGYTCGQRAKLDIKNLLHRSALQIYDEPSCTPWFYFSKSSMIPYSFICNCPWCDDGSDQCLMTVNHLVLCWANLKAFGLVVCDCPESVLPLSHLHCAFKPSSPSINYNCPTHSIH